MLKFEARITGTVDMFARVDVRRYGSKSKFSIGKMCHLALRHLRISRPGRYEVRVVRDGSRSRRRKGTLNLCLIDGHSRIGDPILRGSLLAKTANKAIAEHFKLVPGKTVRVRVDARKID